MGVCGYRIIEIKTERTCSFSWGYDSDILDFMEAYVSTNDQTNEDACGIYEFDAEEFLEFYNEVWLKISKLDSESFREEVSKSVSYVFSCDLKRKTNKEIREIMDNAYKTFLQFREDALKTKEEGNYWVQYLCY